MRGLPLRCLTRTLAAGENKFQPWLTVKGRAFPNEIGGVKAGFILEGRMPRYKTVKEGEWVRPVMKGYRMKCCDCGLVHIIDFKVIKWGRGHKVLLRAKRV